MITINQDELVQREKKKSAVLYHTIRRNIFFLFCINTQQQNQVEIVDKKAVGVCYQTNGKEHMVKVEKEIIVSAGTVASPQVCMRL